MALRHDRQADRPRGQSSLRHSGRRKDSEDRGHGLLNATGAQGARSAGLPGIKTMKLRLFGLAGVIILFSAGSFAQQPYPPTTDHAPPAWFVDVASKASITVRNVNGSIESKRYIIEATGSGVAILDYDRDGWPDIFLVNGTTLPGGKTEDNQDKPTNHLFHNNHDG